MVRLLVSVLVMTACGGGTGRNDSNCTNTDECTLGASRCAGNVIELCVEVVNRCTLWQAETDCGEATAVCDASSGTPTCVTGCQDTCTSLGATRCAGTVVQQCQQAMDGCMAWADGQDCGSTGQVCDNTFDPVQCECDHACARSEDYCSGNTSWHCVESGFGCRSWQTTDCASESCYVGDDGATCGQACTAHSRDQCGADAVCEPQVDANGLQGWICIDLLTDGGSIISTVGAFEECDADTSDGLDNQCAEGAVCQTRAPSDVAGECRPYCDATSTSSEPGATCPSLARDAALIGAPDWFAYGGSSTWSTTAAAGGVVLVEETNTELAFVAAPLLAGNAYNTIGYLDGGTPALLVTEDWTAATPQLGATMAGVRLSNASEAGVDPALVRALTPPLAPAQSTAFLPFSFEAGTGFFVSAPTGWRFEYVAAGSEPLATAVDVILLPDAGDPPVAVAWHELEPPADLDTTGAAIRVINGAGDARPLTVAFPATADQDVAFGASSAWHVAEIADGVSADVDVMVSWSSGGGSFVHAVAGVSRGDVVTLVTRDDPDVFDGVLAEELRGVGDPGVDDVALRVSNVSAVEVVYASAVSLATVLGGTTLPVADGVLQIAPGTVALAVRPAGGDVSVAPAALSAWHDVSAQAAVAHLVHNNAGLAVSAGPYAIPDVSALSAGQVLVAFANAAPGLGRLSVFSSAPLACGAWADDVGLCAWP